MELLRRGAARATNLELVGTHEDDATAIAREAGVADRVERRLGEIAVDPGVAPVADVVLHRVQRQLRLPDFDTGLERIEGLRR